MDPELAAALEWYAKLAETPGWRGQAWHSANTLAREHPSVFGRLLDLLEERTGQRRPAGAVQKGPTDAGR